MFRKIMSTIEVLLVLAAMLGSVFGAIAYLDHKHAAAVVAEANARALEEYKAENLKKEAENLKKEVILRSDMLDEKIDDRSKTLYFYRDTEEHRKLEPAEKSRKRYIEEDLERSYKQQDSYQRKIERLEEKE